MNSSDWRWPRKLRKLLSTQQPEPAQQAQRIVSTQLHIVLPARVGVIAVTLYYVLGSGWSKEMESTYKVVLDNLTVCFFIYIACIIVASAVFLLRRYLPAG